MGRAGNGATEPGPGQGEEKVECVYGVKKMKLNIWSHESLHDWCHICGKRSDKTADVFYPDNAEGTLRGFEETSPYKYVRICKECGQEIVKAANGLIRQYD